LVPKSKSSRLLGNKPEAIKSGFVVLLEKLGVNLMEAG